MKKRTIEVFQEWRKGWNSPDIFVKKDQRKKYSQDNKLLLREHTLGEYPFVKYEN